MGKSIKGKILEFNVLVKELSDAFALIFKEGKEDEYRDEAKSIIDSFSKARKIVEEMYYLYLGRNIDQN